MSLMLNPRGICVPDKPPGLFRYGPSDNAEVARVFEPFISLLLSDDEAWDALFTEAHRLKIAKSVWGKHLKKPKALSRQGSLL